METQPLTLYLDLEPGQTADLEVTARAAIAWSKAIKEIAFILAPDADVSIDLRSGTEGSLGLNTLLRAAKIDRATLRTIAASAATWFALEIGSYSLEKILDQIFASTPAIEAPLTPHERDMVRNTIEKGGGRHHMQEVYRELERDPAIRGVGVTAVPGQRPEEIVPRAEFERRGNLRHVQQVSASRRIRPARFEALLIKPVLVPGTRRRWRFQTVEGEMGFIMGDEQFAARVLTGEHPVPMVAGLILDVSASITEEMENGVWVIKERRIDQVNGYRRPDLTQSLLFPSSHDDEEDDD